MMTSEARRHAQWDGIRVADDARLATALRVAWGYIGAAEKRGIMVDPVELLENLAKWSGVEVSS
jgi:hypothetical protein